MLKSLREKLCCGKPDTADDHEQTSHPVEVPHKAYSQIETTPTPSNVKPKVATVGNPVKRDLWKEAFISLPDDRKRYLMVKEGCSTVDVIKNVIKTTEQKYKEWKEGGLKIRRRDGNDFDVRDSAEKILHCAFQARDLISKAVSLDPTGHASAAWSIVSVGLTMIQNDIQRRDAVFAASEYLADTLAYYTSIDAHHRDQNVDSDQNLDNALLGVYSAILDYSAEVNKVREQNAIVRVGMSINAIADQPLEQLKASVKEKGQSADNWAYLSDSRHNRKKAEDTLAKIDQSIAINKHIESKVLTAEEERILEWISTADYSRIQKETQEFRNPNTHNWFLTSNQYQDWKDSPGHILWLCGIVGCGKSVLCSTVIQDIKSLCEESSRSSFAYWYFQFSNEKTRSVENMVRSLIRQFSQKPLAQSTPGEMFLVLDALDECPERSGRNERKVLLSLLAGLNESHRNKLHILATSRPEQDIRATLERFPTVDLEAQLSEDVETFVRTEVNNGRLRDFEESKRARALDQLLRTRDRRFRWADLQLTRLAGCHTDLQIEHALRTIPETLEETYRGVLDRVEGKDINIAREILLLLCLAPVPLDIRAIADAVSLRSPDMVVKICTTALVIVSTDGEIRLAHFSVKEYLVVSENFDRYRFSETKGHHELAIKTINLLLSKNETLAAEVAMAQPFLVYAAKHWGTHVGAAGDVLDIQGLIDRLFTEPKTYFNWLRIAEDGGYSTSNPWHKVPEECEQPIYRASSMGLAYTVETLFDQGSDPLEPSEGKWGNALTVAARNGHFDIVEFLLGKDITVNKRSVMDMMSHIDHKNHGKAKLETIVNIIWDLGLLFDESKTPDKIIDEEIISNVMINSCALGLMRLLLDRRHEASIPITDEVLCDAIVLCGKEMIEVLLETCSEDIHIGPSFFVKLEKRYCFDYTNYGGLDVVLVNRATELAVDDCSVACWAHNASSKAMGLMLRTHPDIRVIGETLIAAASNRFGADMIRLLFDKREPDTQISERLLLAAAANHKCPEILSFKVLIEEISPDAPLSEKVSEDVVRKGLAMVRLVIDKQQAGFVVSEKMMKIAAASWEDDSVELLQLLMTNGGAEVPITEAIICAAAGNRFRGASIMEYLFQVQEDSLPITENVLIAAVKSPQTLEIILNRCPEARITDSVFVAAYLAKDAMLVLLSKPHNGLPVEAIMTRIKTNRFGTSEVLRLLVDRNLVDVDAWTVEAVASNPENLEVLLSKKPDVLITQKALVRATDDLRSVRLLLKAEKNHDLVTEEVMMAAAKHKAKIMRSILHRVESVPLTANVLKKALCHRKTDTVKLILAQRPDLNLKASLEEIWHDVDMPGREKGHAVVVVGELTDFEVTESLLQDFDRLISTLCFYHAPIPATEGVGVIVLERCHHEVAESFLQYYPEIPITDTLLQAVERNPRADKEALRSLLAGKRGSA
ncbi:hypothetical protein BDV37DRAFT_295452 [Aspergillus pseudonomiae]|uniref:NACHT domain-containing protein n=1 Tax=Aspergillus pseudonomiae TaxID=1506151 RepID=A0A5N7D792_9EURO|nr:uncharacterized protein BDV37DRAFT_295452 [Aspergillus pseudonomiae]KAE8402302.1 hypothetical protein BDV37DRAFT_295452 [Aspergillus pseudonomiae]